LMEQRPMGGWKRALQLPSINEKESSHVQSKLSES